jgi:hypothetical protein
MKKNNLSFMVELLIMLAIFIVLINVLVGVYAISRKTSADAKHLSDAVILASNGAEVFIATDSDEEMMKILNQNDNVKNEDGLVICYNDKLEPDPDGRMMMKIERQSEDDFVHAHISVTYDDKLIYELETGRVQKGGGQ